MALLRFKPLKAEQGLPQWAARLVGSVQENFEQLSKVSRLNYVQVSASITSGSNSIEHKLGRQPVGWAVTDVDSGASFYRSAWNAKTITLVSTATSNLKLEVW